MCRHRSCNRFILLFRSSRPIVFLRKDVLKICSKFTREHPCKSAISTKLQSNLIEIALRHGCSPVNLLYIFRTPFPKNTSEGLLLSQIHFCIPFLHNSMFKVNNRDLLIHKSLHSKLTMKTPE